MDTFSDWSPSGFGPAKPYDPTGDLTFGERLTRGGGFAEAYDAAERSQRLVANTAWEKARIEDAYATLIDKVKGATGVTLDNPMMVNTAEIAERITRGEFHGFTDPRLGDLVLQRRDAFTETLAELKAQHPAALADLDPFVDPRTLGAANARRAEADSTAVWENRDANPVLKGAGLLAGGIVGYLRDPTFVASLFAPAGGRATTAVGRIASATVTQGLVNAGLMAASEPAIQEGRAAAGLDHGWREAAGDVAAAAAFGAVPGFGVQATKELAPLLARVRAGRATRSDVEAIRTAGVHVDDETMTAIAAAERFDEAGAEMLAARPEGIPDHAAPLQLAEGLRAVDDPSAPLPLVDRPIPPGTTDDLARGLVDGSASMMDAVDRLRAADGAIDSALASTDPMIRDIGRLATLDEGIIARVVRGELALGDAAIVAATTPDPHLQAAAAAALDEARPATPAAAREVVSDAVMRARPVEAPSPPVAPRPARASSGDLRDAVPLRRDDGTPVLVSRADLARVAERERWMGEVIAACKL